MLAADKTNEAANEILLDKMLYLIAQIHRISLRVFFEDEDGVEMTHLHSKWLKKNLGRAGKVTYAKVIEYLLLLDLIEVDDSYKISNYSKSYGIKNRNKLFHVYQVELNHWQPKERKDSMEHTNDGKIILKTIEENISKISVDRAYVELVNINEVNRFRIMNSLYFLYTCTRCASVPAPGSRINLVSVSDDEYGRVHHNLTGIGRKYRPALTIDGEDIYSTDLSASQMYFGIKGLKGYAKMKANSGNWDKVCEKFPDVLKYIEAVLNGEFYNVINEHLGFTHEELKANKVKTLMPIFSKKDPKRKTKYLKALEAKFPTFLKFINTKKKNDYADASRYLQREESSLMIRRVCGRLTELGIWFVPVHDCILSKKGDIALVKQIIEEEGAAYNGYKPHIKTSNWTGAKEKLTVPITKEERADFLLKNTIAYKEHKASEARNRVVNEIIRKRKQKAKSA